MHLSILADAFHGLVKLHLRSRSFGGGKKTFALYAGSAEDAFITSRKEFFITDYFLGGLW